VKVKDAMADAQHHEEGRTGTIQERETAPPGELEARAHTPRIAHTVLLLTGLVALFAIGVSMSNYTNYIRSVESVHGLRLEMTSLQVIDDTNPRAVIRFRLHNRSPLTIEIEDYHFNLYLNGERVGTSMSSYMGTDPNVSQAAYRKATNINQALDPDQHLDLEFTLYIYSAQMEIVRRAQRTVLDTVQCSDSMSWSTNANFRVILPYAPEWDWVGLSAEFEE